MVKAGADAKVLIIGQAPGRKVHETGVPWDDPSGRNLRKWLGVSEDTFYDENKFALVPMGFCFPGTGKSGDLPPRPECAPLWHPRLMSSFNSVKLTLLVGQYAQRYYLPKEIKTTLTETVRTYKDCIPSYFPLPHPSPRNNMWMKRNPWFQEQLVPELKHIVKRIL